MSKTYAIPESLRYDPPTYDSEWARRALANARPPKQRILFPASIDDLKKSWMSQAKASGLTPKDVAKAAGMSESRLREAMRGDATIGEAMSISRALGCSLKRIPAGLRAA